MSVFLVVGVFLGMRAWMHGATAWSAWALRAWGAWGDSLGYGMEISGAKGAACGAGSKQQSPLRAPAHPEPTDGQLA